MALPCPRTPASRRLIAGLAALTTAFTLTACGGGADQPGAAGPPPAVTAVADQKPTFNDADVTFAQRMIPHHLDALRMAALAPDRASSPKVKALAKAILGAQSPEIETMTGWLRTWGKEVPTAEPMDHSGDMAGMTMGEMPMAGMNESRLAAAHGKAFDRLFVTFMTRHHEGAITDAKAEQKAGLSPAALALAADIAKAQATEVAKMKKLA